MDQALLMTQDWLQQVVLGLKLCPFAGKPTRENRIRFVVCDSTEESVILQALIDEIILLEKSTASEIETTLLITPNALKDFYDYNDFLSQADDALEEHNWVGEFQIASFHPHYQFAGTEPDDDENLTNRSPFPILHILREASISAAVDGYAEVDKIGERNIASIAALSPSEKRSLFAYLYR